MSEKIFSYIKEMYFNKGKEFNRPISNEDNLRDDIGLDSFDLAELTVRIESDFGVDVFEDGIVNTIEEIIKKIENKKNG
jgi:acyl carrier protein